VKSKAATQIPDASLIGKKYAEANKREREITERAAYATCIFFFFSGERSFDPLGMNFYTSVF